MIKVGEYKVIEDYYYEPTHVWMRIEDDGTVTVGLDDFGQKAAGKIVFIRATLTMKQILRNIIKVYWAVIAFGNIIKLLSILLRGIESIHCITSVESKT